ncbi:vWA domain-containing protein [Methylibium petroleiphilum]|uniref:VWFA domain-containing protein n=1 Tax=Methylibium petroleiphilum (strain ATCC BAA-1232 / LMG 22953 / PM1) TaxID=420662 RepID=A2SP98_METPP|nr:vWA domain-containing protein [Methylibium petroleiphilum]ABM97387.1 hypothetical protein Mpe_B0623 [Methylibium petroleiphilum PM1]
MATAPQATQSSPAASQPQGVTRHVTDEGMEKALGIGQGGKRLNTHAHDLQERIDDARDDFLEVRTFYVGGRDRHDFLKNGLLGEIVSRTPILVYDLPELKAFCNTAFVDRSGKMYIADTFCRRLLSEHDAGLDSLNYVFRHEADHLRRLHLARMLDYPHSVANAATDTRINIDIVKGEAAERAEAEKGSSLNDNEVREAIKKYLAEHAQSSISVFYGMTLEEHVKYDGMSEEAIAALMMKDWKEPPPLPNREVSFEHIMEGAAQEADNVKGMLLAGKPLAPTAPPYVMTPNELSGLAQDLRTIGKAKANPSKVSDQDLQSAYDRLAKLREHQGLIELDNQHIRAAMGLLGKGASHSSGKTGDAYLDMLKPSERVEMAMKILEKILQPQKSNGMPQQPQNGGLTIKDLERAMGRGGAPNPGNGNSQSGGQPGDQAGAQDGSGTEDMVPAPTVTHGQDHVMSTEDLAQALHDAGVSSDTMAKLGFDDLKKIPEEVKHAKDGVVSAINKASEDQMKVGSRYPGGHLLHYAKAQMLDFFKPVLTWEMAHKKLLEACGKGSRYDPTEPWTLYHVDAADMGFKHQRDVPFMGSRMPGKEQKPLMFDIIDTSGSVDDAMLKRFVSEALNQARRVSRGVAPDVLISWADTICRGVPEFISEKNYKQFLTKGINYGGRGGTNFQAAIENVLEMVKPGSKSGYAKRNIDAICYMTDSGDSVPDPARLLRKAQECGLKKLPPILFLVPKSCYDERFAKEASKWATVVYFHAGPGAKHTQKVDINAAAREQDQKNRNLKAPRP